MPSPFAISAPSRHLLRMFVYFRDVEICSAGFKAEKLPEHRHLLTISEYQATVPDWPSSQVGARVFTQSRGDRATTRTHPVTSRQIVYPTVHLGGLRA